MGSAAFSVTSELLAATGFVSAAGIVLIAVDAVTSALLRIPDQRAGETADASADGCTTDIAGGDATYHGAGSSTDAGATFSLRAGCEGGDQCECQKGLFHRSVPFHVELDVQFRSDAAHQHQDDEDEKYEAQAARRAVAPATAMAPVRQRTDEQQN
jgi:hypothetical protein